MTKFLPPPIEAGLGDIDTQRLHLRKFRLTDLDALSRVFAKPEVWRFPFGRGLTRSETESFLKGTIDEWEQCQFGCWIAIEKKTDEVVGYVGLSVPMFLPEILPAVEVGWRFDPGHWGRGFATEGAQAALREGFTTLGLDQITSVPQVGNPASARVADRLGMRLERTVKIPANDRRGELLGHLYVTTNGEWLSHWVGRRGDD